VLVICIDALRADHVGAYGYPRATTPSIDRLAAEGVVFESAFSAASWTKPSVPSYFTGRYPWQHGVYEGSREEDGRLVSDVLASEERTLAELFRAKGYQTVALVTNGQIRGALGFSQGFDAYYDGVGAAELIRARFLEWLDGASGDAPFFSYLHFLDVHLPYDPPGPYRTAFGDAVSEVDFGTASWKLLKQRIRDREVQISERDRQAMVDLYDGELLYVDTEIGRILAALDARGLLENTLVVVLSDHGEALLERDEIGHGGSLYDELLRVPFIFRFPGDQHAGVRVQTPVSTVDLLPTLVDTNGLEMPADLAGRSLVPLLTGPRPGAARALYAEGIHGTRYQQALRIGGWKYVVTTVVRSGDEPDSEEPPQPGSGAEPAQADAQAASGGGPGSGQHEARLRGGEGGERPRGHANRRSRGGSAKSQRVRARLQEGLRVEVEGTWTQEGRFLAESVEIQEDQDDDDEVVGAIEAIEPGAAELTLLSYRVRLKPQARIQDHLRRPIDRNALEVGDLVKISGRARTAEDFDASKLGVRDPRRRKKQKLAGQIVGPVEVEGEERTFRIAARVVRASGMTEFSVEGKQETDAARRRTDPRRSARETLPVREELYHLDSDPGERDDVSASHEAKLQEMRALLAQLGDGSGIRAAPARPLDEAEIGALRELGYVD
jgi:arylsulfatase